MLNILFALNLKPRYIAFDDTADYWEIRDSIEHNSAHWEECYDIGGLDLPYKVGIFDRSEENKETLKFEEKRLIDDPEEFMKHFLQPLAEGVICKVFDEGFGFDLEGFDDFKNFEHENEDIKLEEEAKEESSQNESEELDSLPHNLPPSKFFNRNVVEYQREYVNIFRKAMNETLTASGNYVPSSESWRFFDDFVYGCENADGARDADCPDFFPGPRLEDCYVSDFDYDGDFVHVDPEEKEMCKFENFFGENFSFRRKAEESIIRVNAENRSIKKDFKLQNTYQVGVRKRETEIKYRFSPNEFKRLQALAVYKRVNFMQLLASIFRRIQFPESWHEEGCEKQASWSEECYKMRN